MKEAALIEQARAEFAQRVAPGAGARSSAKADAVAPAARPAVEAAVPSTAADPEQRVAALLVAARAQSERLRLRQRRIYVWAPVVIFYIVGLWTLLWLWQLR